MLAMNVGFGLKYSYITSIVNTRADGVPRYDHDRVEAILTDMHDKPCLSIDPRAIESRVMALQDVDEAELTRNVFGSALLKVRYREPVARLADRPQVALSTDGVLYRSSLDLSALPTLKMPSSGPPILIAMMGSWQPACLAALAVYSRKHYPTSAVGIEVDPRGVVCLNIDSGNVILGSCDDLDSKLKTLESRLQKNPNELMEVKSINLTLPSAPTIVPKPGEKKS
ncbi:MAG: hypothetical protein P4L46_04440 [Fimbriimonas sp.]|nr:hypothetical protein [Fimbriimonas sp.]